MLRILCILFILFVPWSDASVSWEYAEGTVISLASLDNRAWVGFWMASCKSMTVCAQLLFVEQLAV